MVYPSIHHWSGESVLVTGCTSRLGPALLCSLIQRNARVTGLFDRDDRPTTALPSAMISRKGNLGDCVRLSGLLAQHEITTIFAWAEPRLTLSGDRPRIIRDWLNALISAATTTQRPITLVVPEQPGITLGPTVPGITTHLVRLPTLFSPDDESGTRMVEAVMASQITRDGERYLDVTTTAERLLDGLSQHDVPGGVIDLVSQAWMGRQIAEAIWSGNLAAMTEIAGLSETVTRMKRTGWPAYRREVSDAIGLRRSA